MDDEKRPHEVIGGPHNAIGRHGEHRNGERTEMVPNGGPTDERLANRSDAGAEGVAAMREWEMGERG